MRKMHHGFKKCLVALAIFFCAEEFRGISTDLLVEHY
jgi:hypothetical protein